MFLSSLITISLCFLVPPPVTDEDTVKRYYAKFEERFFQTCEKELLKINTFYSGICFLQSHLSLSVKSQHNEDDRFRSAV